MMQLREALSAKSMSAMYKDSGDLLADVEPVSAVVAEVEAPRLIVCLNNHFVHILPLVLLVLKALLLLLLSSLLQTHM